MNSLNPINFLAYKTLILDIDGVIFDSNKIKEKNIFEATKQFTNKEAASKFTPYFIKLSGIPRETKINSYFNNQPEIAQEILNYYNELNDLSIYSAEFTAGAYQFIKQYSKELTFIALSGGAEYEILKLFDLHGIKDCFKSIFGGPKTKIQNIQKVQLEDPVLYIGDSIVDFDTATTIGADFLFMYGYTSHQNWKSVFKKKKILGTIKNLKEINDN